MVAPLSILPASSRMDRLRWVDQDEDKRQELTDEVKIWLSHISNANALFEKHVYSNENCSDFDLRQHRQALHALIAAGESIAVNCVEFQLLPDLVDTIDGEIKALNEVLRKWHAPLSEGDIPESLRESFAELDSDNLVDF